MRSLRGDRVLLVAVIVCWCLLQWTTCLPLGGSYGGIVREKESEDLCTLCLDVVKLAQDLVDSNATLDDILPLAVKVCEGGLRVFGPYTGTYMCPGFMKAYIPVIQYVLTQKVFDPREVCEALHLCNRTSSHHHDNRGSPLLQHIDKHFESLIRENERKRKYENSLYLPSSSQREAEMRQYSAISGHHEQTRSGMKRDGSSNTITFLQLTDIHFDKKYSEGAHPHCHLYLCCRSWYNGTGSAGHYGAYECDLPFTTLELVTDAVKKLEPQPDFIVFTGDNSPHEIWNESFSSTLEASQFVLDYLAQQLPNFTIYPAMGNHETWPESEYLGSLADYQNLTRTLARYWTKLVDLPPEAVTTISKGGYYSTNITDKLRLLSFNSNYGYSINFYSFLNDQDPSYNEQNDWIMEQLAQAERAGQKVLVISHVPPGDMGNHAAYGEFYLNMTKRFSDTIVGHLFGHTHMDQFQLIQDADGAYGTVLVAPSVTPYGFMNPSFRTFTMDTETFQLLDYQQYHLNLTKANELASQNITPEFELVYKATEEYGLKDLSPNSYTDLVERFKTGDSGTEMDHYHYNIHGRSMFFEEICGPICKWETLCQVSNVISTNVWKCLAKF